MPGAFYHQLTADPLTYPAVNCDLVVSLHREPEPGWVHLDFETWAVPVAASSPTRSCPTTGGTHRPRSPEPVRAQSGVRSPPGALSGGWTRPGRRPRSPESSRDSRRR
ncbi:hypothetical protein GJR88_02600 [Dietzia sp. DQ12-45-1b]|nr:hypothetical protein GJR88_02600 [Dietzia sp. DQ12-45-1b]